MVNVKLCHVMKVNYVQYVTSIGLQRKTSESPTPEPMTICIPALEIASSIGKFYLFDPIILEEFSILVSNYFGFGFTTLNLVET